jgi:hypothetical protein
VWCGAMVWCCELVQSGVVKRWPGAMRCDAVRWCGAVQMQHVNKMAQSAPPVKFQSWLVLSSTTHSSSFSEQTLNTSFTAQRKRDVEKAK